TRLRRDDALQLMHEHDRVHVVARRGIHDGQRTAAACVDAEALEHLDGLRIPLDRFVHRHADGQQLVRHVASLHGAVTPASSRMRSATVVFRKNSRTPAATPCHAACAEHTPSSPQRWPRSRQGGASPTVWNGPTTSSNGTLSAGSFSRKPPRAPRTDVSTPFRRSLLSTRAR